jgi:hypothetical protein
VTRLLLRLLFSILPFSLFLLLHSQQAAAQDASSHDPGTSGFQFLPRYAFHLSAEYLSGADRRFVWDANFGGELDFIDYGRGRLTFEANYQTILGEEIRPFDPNQGNYILSGRLSARVRGFEAAGVFYHQSRHFSDRSKQLPVDWNMVGGRVSKTIKHERVTLETRVDLRKVVQKTLVDYRWEFEGRTRSTIPVRRDIALFGGATARVLGVDGSQNRGTQHGYRAEGGVRFTGRAGAIELYLSGERRIDPYPLEFGTAQWMGIGFRFLSRDSEGR